MTNKGTCCYLFILLYYFANGKVAKTYPTPQLCPSLQLLYLETVQNISTLSRVSEADDVNLGIIQRRQLLAWVVQYVV